MVLGQVVGHDRPRAPTTDVPGPSGPASYDDLLEAFDEYSSRARRRARAGRPGRQAWTWSSEQTVGFTFRRQAHEALIHRLDAEQTAGDVTPLDPPWPPTASTRCST